MNELFVAVFAVTALSMCFASTRWVGMLGVFVLLTVYTGPTLFASAIIGLVYLVVRHLKETGRWR